MAELPECLKSVRSRIRSLFGFSPEKNRKFDDEDSPCAESGESVQYKRSPSPARTDKKRGRKKMKTKSSLFNLKSPSSRQKEVASLAAGTKAGSCRRTSAETSDAKPNGFPGSQDTMAPVNSGQTLSEKFGVPSDDMLRTIDEAMNDTFVKYDIPLTLDENGMIAPNTTGPGRVTKSKDENLRQGSAISGRCMCGPVHSSNSQGDKVKISSVYVKEINQIKFERSIQTAMELNPTEKKTGGDGGGTSDVKIYCDSKHKNTCSERNDFPNRLSQNVTTKSDDSKMRPPNSESSMPWDNMKKQCDGNVFLFKDNGRKDAEIASSAVPVKTSFSSSGKPFTKARSSDFSCQHPITKDASAQCDLDIYPCTCVIAENGRKIICPLCVDQPVSSKDKILIARNRDINSPTEKKSNKDAQPKLTRKLTPICSSVTQTSLTAHDTVDLSVNPARYASEQVERREPKKEPGAALKKSLDKSIQQGEVKCSPVYHKGKPVSVSPEGQKRTNQPITPKSSLIRPVTAADPQGKGSGDAGAKESAGVEVKAPDNKLEKIKNIWKLMKGSKRRSDSDDCESLLFDLSGDIGDTPDPMADLFLAATAQDLDRIDGITAKDEKKEPEGPLTSPAPPPNTEAMRVEKSQSSRKKAHRIRTRRLPPKEDEDPQKEDKPKENEESERKEDDSDDDAFEAADMTSSPIANRSQNPEEPITGENAGFAFNDSFELGSYFRIDDHLDPGQKASRGQIPEIKVKLKRRGEPNKHLIGKRRVSEELHCGEYGPLDNSEDDPGSLCYQNEEMSAAGTIDTRDVTTPDEATGSDPHVVATGEDVDTSEVVADTRHCNYVALEVLHGKKSDRDNIDEEYQPRSSSKKKKGRQRGRDRGKPPPCLGINFL